MTGLLRWKVRCWDMINAARMGTKTCPPLTITIYSIAYFLPHNLMLPDAALTLGLAAGTNVFAFCQP